EVKVPREHSRTCLQTSLSRTSNPDSQNPLSSTISPPERSSKRTMKLRSIVTCGVLAWMLGGMPARAPAETQQKGPEDLIPVEVATVGIGLVSRVPVVILHDPVSDKTMPVWIGTSEAEAIARSLFKIKSPRPMTHDLLADLIRAMDGNLEEVLVNDSKDGVYY